VAGGFANRLRVVFVAVVVVVAITLVAAQRANGGIRGFRSPVGRPSAAHAGATLSTIPGALSRTTFAGKARSGSPDSPDGRTSNAFTRRAASDGLVNHSGKADQSYPRQPPENQVDKFDFSRASFSRPCPGVAAPRPGSLFPVVVARGTTMGPGAGSASAARQWRRCEAYGGRIKATVADSFSRGSGKARPGLGRGQRPRPRCY